MAKVDTSGDCWIWLAARVKGYGRFWVNGHTPPAHRWFYEQVRGPIDSELVLDHLCRNPSCVNPAHLEPVTDAVNVLRGVGPAAQNARKTRCPHGHEYTPENTLVRSCGRRQCVACRESYNAAKRKRQAA